MKGQRCTALLAEFTFAGLELDAELIEARNARVVAVPPSVYL